VRGVTDVPASTVTCVNIRIACMSTWMNWLVSPPVLVQLVVVLPSSARPALALFVNAVAVHPVRTYVVATVAGPTYSSSIDQVNAVPFVEFTRMNRACCIGKLTTTTRDVPVPLAICVNVVPSLDTDTV